MFKRKKAQIVLTDLFIALFVATILLVVIIFAWNRYSVIIEENSYYEGMQIIAFQTADLLVKSAGEPENWENDPENVYVIGLAGSDRTISEEKLDAFINLPLNISSRSLGIEIYDFYFQLKYINGTRLADYGKGSSKNKSTVNVQRLVIYKNEKAVVEFGLWT